VIAKNGQREQKERKKIQ